MDSNVFRIRFSGKCLPGFDELFVRQTLRNNLGFTQHQVASIFRGRPVTLKRNMEERPAREYESRLRQIGMDVICEAEQPDTGVRPKSHPAPVQPPVPATQLARPAAAVKLSLGEPTTSPSQIGQQTLLAPTLLMEHAATVRPTVEPRVSPSRQTTPPPAPPPQTSVAPVQDAMPPGPAPLEAHAFTRPLPRRHPIPPMLIPVAAPAEPPPAPPESEFLSTILAEQDRLADHSTDRRDFLSLSFTGRMHGMHYIWLMGITYLLICLANVSDVLWRLSPHGSQVASRPSLIWLAITCILLLQTARLSVLRLHDLDRSGLWAGAFIALYLVIGLFGSTRFANIILQFSILALAVPLGDRFPNRYGGRPEAPEDLLGWFDPGRRCHRNYFLSRSVGIINAGIIATVIIGALAGLGEAGLRLAGIDTSLFSHTLLSLWPPLCVMGLSLFLRMTIARLHDLELRGTWIVPYIGAVWGLYILMMIPGLGIEVVAGVLINLATLIVFVALCITSGSPASNRFGRASKITSLADLWKGLSTLVTLCCIGLVIGILWFHHFY